MHRALNFSLLNGLCANTGLRRSSGASSDSKPTRSLLLSLCLLCAACTPFVSPPPGRVATPTLDKAHFVTADGTALPVRSWLPVNGHFKAVIVALHGFNDYSNFFTQPGTYFSQRGIACYAYDQRGFGGSPQRGLWPGVAAYTNDLAQFTRLVQLRHPGVPVYLLGESMGAAVIISAMTEDHPPLADGIILSAPAVWGRQMMPWYQRWLLWIGAHTVPWLTVTGKGLRIIASDNIEMLRGLGRDPMVIKETRVDAIYGLANLMDRALARSAKLDRSTLVLYGEHDQVVPKQPLYRMLRQMPESQKKRIAFYKDGYHLLLRDLKANLPWKDIVAWIDNHIKPLPSGADKRVAQVLARSD
jgi:acylglycerol lipase